MKLLLASLALASFSACDEAPVCPSTASKCDEGCTGLHATMWVEGEACIGPRGGIVGCTETKRPQVMNAHAAGCFRRESDGALFTSGYEWTRARLFEGGGWALCDEPQEQAMSTCVRSSSE